jgi:hypothetical protein
VSFSIRTNAATARPPVIAQRRELIVGVQQGRVGVGVVAAADAFHAQQQLGERGPAAVPD